MIFPRRAPYGARGLKYVLYLLIPPCNGSCPVRGTWIEIVRLLDTNGDGERRAPYGARGLKYHLPAVGVQLRRVVPRKGHVD